jgi:hypothetical protein
MAAPVPVGNVAFLKIVTVNDNGAFLDCPVIKDGQTRDLLLPYSEVPPQRKTQLEPGKWIMVMVFVDDQRRVAASARLSEFLLHEASEFQEGDKVTVVIDERNDLGVRVIVNHRYWGIVHNNEIFQPLQQGDVLDGYIKTLRADKRLNISLTAPGPAKFDSIAEGILSILERNDGFMAVSDKTPPELIYKLFGVSKKAFKQAIGRLYKERKILIEERGIRRV